MTKKTTPALPVLDLAQYTRAPIFSLPEGVALSFALLDCAPKDLSPLEKRWVQRLRQGATAAQAALVTRQREAAEAALGDAPTATLDPDMDATFSGLRMRLDGLGSLPDSATPKAARARKLSAQLFSDGGLTFLQFSHAEEWSHITTLLSRIDSDGLAKEIDTLAGPEYLAHIRALLPSYGRMVNTQLQRTEGSGENLVAHRLELTRAISGYANSICAALDDEDAASIRRVETSLRPLVAHRAAADRRAPTPAPAPTPTPAPAPTP